MSLLSAGYCAWLNAASPEEIDALESVYTVQLLLIKKLQQTSRTTTSTRDRYRVVLSDGVHFVHAMLATHLNELVALGDLVKHAVVVVDKAMCNYIRDIRLVIILDLHVLSKYDGKIGDPVGLRVCPHSHAHRELE